MAHLQTGSSSEFIKNDIRSSLKAYASRHKKNPEPTMEDIKLASDIYLKLRYPEREEYFLKFNDQFIQSFREVIDEFGCQLPEDFFLEVYIKNYLLKHLFDIEKYCDEYNHNYSITIQRILTIASLFNISLDQQLINEIKDKFSKLEAEKINPSVERRLRVLISKIQMQINLFQSEN